jgi:hypothetical protein
MDEDAKAVQIDVGDPTKIVQIRASFDPKLESELVDFLQRNKDMFPWCPTEMPTVSREVAKHTLNIKPSSRTIKQGMWCFNQEKHRAMDEELSRLLVVVFVKEVQHPDRIAIPILVPKKNEKWWMCVDYTSLHKACSNHPFPLPRID